MIIECLHVTGRKDTILVLIELCIYVDIHANTHMNILINFVIRRKGYMRK